MDNWTSIQENEEKIISLQRTNEELTSEIEQFKKQLTESRNFMLEKSQAEERFIADIVEDKKIIAGLHSQLTHLTEDNQTLANEIEKIRNANEVDLQQLSNDCESEKSKLQEDIDTMNRTLDENQAVQNGLSEKNAELMNELEACTSRLNEKSAEVDELNGALEQLQQKRSQENDELLSEMREINEALKNRGDVISKQKQSIGELNDKIDQLQHQLVQLSAVNDAANKQIEQLNERLKEMESKSFVDGKSFSGFSWFPFNSFLFRSF